MAAMATSPLPQQRPPVLSSSFRRSFTLPPRSLSFHEQAGLDPSDSAADILYFHPKARIIKFIPPIDAVRSVSSPLSFEYDYPVDTIETLPWRSSTEETLALGSLVIEKIRGSTNFLRSGNKPLHALMKNSQCWCVDDEATLVMRVGAFKYYRIELPYATEEDKRRVQELKDVLKGILRFEATPCPFKRGFHVDLPESATTPRRKGTWKRKPGSLLSSPVSATTSPLSLNKTRMPKASDGWEARREESPHSLDQKRTEDEDEDEDEESSGEEADLDKQAELSGKLADEDHSAPIETESETTKPLGNRSDSPTGVTVYGTSTESPADLTLKPWSDNFLELSGDRPDGLVQASAKVAVEQVGYNDRSTSPDGEVTGDIEEEMNGQSSSHLDKVSESMANNALSTVMEADAMDHQLQIGQPEHHQAAELDTDLGEAEKCSESLYDNPDETHENEIQSNGSVQTNGTLAEVTAQLSESIPKPRISTDFGGDSSALATVKFLPDQQPLDDIVEDHHTQTYLQSPDAVSVSSVADSFHSVASFGSRMSDVDNNLNFADSSEPTPVAESHDPLTLLPAHHSRGASEMTIIADDHIPISPVRPRTAASEGPSTPSLFRSSASDSSWPEVETPAPLVGDEGVRQRVRTRRSLSPLPPPSTLFDSGPQSPRGSHLTGAMLQKARHLALGKPIEVVVMLAHILARIAGGATFNDLMNGDLFRRPTAEDAAHWRYGKPPVQPGSPRTETSEEDDYGVPIRGRSRSAGPTARRDDDDADSLFDLD